LTKILEIAPDLSLSKDFENVYEILKNDISYAVSPEKDGCTTDVLLHRPNKTELFSFNEFNDAIIKTGYKEFGKTIISKDIGSDFIELKILKKKYISPKGEITTLDFPIENKDKYYMTFFTEKFESNEKTKLPIMAMVN